MTWVSALAVYFIIWWLVLFAMLPLGLRTQDEADDVTLGTTESAPSRSHMPKVIIRTTLVSLAIYGLYYFLSHYLGLDFTDIPRIGPRI